MSEIVAQICFRSFKPAEPRRPIFWCERLRIEGPSPEEERHTHLRGCGASLASHSQPTVSRAWQSWTNGSLDCRAARLWRVDRVAASRARNAAAKSR
jgi:hypothetical protein